jgi:hypothetical protein
MTTRAKTKLKKEIERLKKYEDFYSSVCCIIAEGSEFMTKSEMYTVIKKEMEATNEK